MGAEVPGVERTEEVWPQAELPAAAQEQGELRHSGRRSEGNQEEHWISPRQNQQEVGATEGLFDVNFKISTVSLCNYTNARYKEPLK